MVTTTPLAATRYEQTGSDTGSPVRELDTSTGWVNASTSGLDTGTTYFISNDGSDPSSDADATFTIRTQDFSTSFAAGSVANDAEVDLTFESTNRQNAEYDVYVTSVVSTTANSSTSSTTSARRTLTSTVTPPPTATVS